MGQSVKATLMARQFLGRQSERLELIQEQLKDRFAEMQKSIAESAKKAGGMGHG